MHSGGGQKVVATLRRDGNVVYPKEEASSSPIRQVANLLNYKIKTESELLYKSQNNNNNNSGGSSSNSAAGPTVVDMGKQLLQYARDGDVLGVQHMMARGAPFAADWLGMSAMHFAAMNNDLEICEILLHGGVNKDARTKVDRTPLHLACFYGHERIVQLLLSKKCTVNAIDMLRMTPLHWAVEKQHKSIVRILLKHNADVTAVSKFGKTPLALAVLTEQADLLTELEAARQLQAKSKLSEETEKETSEAINSIIDEPETTRRIDEQDTDLVEGESIDFAVKMTAMDGIKEEAYNASTLNMLKDHGIAMMNEDDDTSKEMLNKALKNGRQLVLSEGGLMLLHETQRNMKQGTNNNNYNANDNGHLEMDGVVSVGSGGGGSGVGGATSTKVRMNVIKQRENNAAQVGAVTKNKNIRIISLNDFKKLCADKKPNAIQKIPSSLASSGVVRQLPDGTKLVNMRQLQSRKLRLPSINDVALDKSYKDDEMIVEEHTAESSDEIKRVNTTASTTTTTTTAAVAAAAAAAATTTTSAAAAVNTPRPYYTKQMCPVQTLQLRPLASNKLHNSTGTVGSIQQQQQQHQQRVQTRSNSHGDSSSSLTAAAATTKPPKVMPLLTTQEICRQLLEMRRQNEDLRRKFEVAQIEKEELRQRLEQLEELVMAKQVELTTTQNES